MSLQHLADQVRSKGRGKDTLLVHMSPREVGGLQSLAMAHGGSLTLNPDTGLPEAGFLESILPTIAGIGLSVAFPAASPWLIGAGVGGATALATGSIQKGLMAGLGGWGGAGIGAGLMGLGGGAGAGASGAALLESGTSGAAGNLMEQAALGGGGMGAFGEGVKQFASSPGSALSSIGYAPVAAALAPAVFNSGEQQQSPIDQSAGYIRPFDYDYRTQQYTPLDPVPANEWGSRSLAEGGEVEDLEAQRAQFRNQTNTNAYRDILGRAPDQAGLEYWNQQAQAGAGFGNIRQAMMQSPEFQSQVQRNQSQQAATSGFSPMSSAEMINTNYYNMTGRRPDPTGFAASMQALQQGQSPEELRQGMLMSPESQSFLSGPNASTQQIGGARLPQRYQQSAQPVSPDVLNYNQMTANRARSEYIDMPQLQAGRPRTPEEMQASRELRNQQSAALREKMNKPQVPEADIQRRIDDAIADALARFEFNDGAIYRNGNVWYGGNQADGMGSGVGPDGNSTGADGGVGGGASGGNANADGSVGGGGSGTGTDGEDGWKRGGAVRRYSNGGISSLGSYSDGGQLLQGPGDGVSDDIPAVIGEEQPARLANGEFVLPARIVSELGNGSTDAGAKQLYAMMDRIQRARGKTIGPDNVAVDSEAYKLLPA